MKTLKDAEGPSEYIYVNRAEADALGAPRGVDSLVLPAITDGKEGWYGMDIDKARYKVVLEDETQDSVYLKIVKIR